MLGEVAVRKRENHPHPFDFAQGGLCPLPSRERETGEGPRERWEGRLFATLRVTLRQGGGRESNSLATQPLSGVATLVIPLHCRILASRAHISSADHERKRLIRGNVRGTRLA